MYFKPLFTLLIAISIFGKLYSQTFDQQKLSSYLHLLDTSNKIMGNILVSQHGKKTYTYTLGYSNLESKEKSSEQTMYRIGSITKTITATLILKAIEEGKITLTDNIQSFFPSLVNASKITISNLLNHHSGIHNFTGGNYINWYTQPISRHDLVDSIIKGGTDFEPGSKAAYSNSNFVLLSFLLEDVYHETYADIVNKKIVQPLHLQHFQVGARGNSCQN